MAALLESRACSRVFCLVRAADPAAAQHRVIEVRFAAVDFSRTDEQLVRRQPRRRVPLICTFSRRRLGSRSPKMK